MKAISAEFRPLWRPGSSAIAGLCVLAVTVVAAVSANVWEQRRVAMLRIQVAQMTDDTRAAPLPPVRTPAPVYAASARQFLLERAAGWAPMLRTLESGSMVGVTPTSVEFSSTDGSARVELMYSDTAALVDYLSRVNEGVSGSTPRWTLVEARAQAGGGPAAGLGTVPTAPPSAYLATIRSNWLETSADITSGGARAP